MTCPPVTPDLGLPACLPLLMLPLLSERLPTHPDIFIDLLLYTRHWGNKGNPKQTWFLPSQSPGMPRKLLFIPQNPTLIPSAQHEVFPDSPKQEPCFFSRAPLASCDFIVEKRKINQPLKKKTQPAPDPGLGNSQGNVRLQASSCPFHR